MVLLYYILDTLPLLITVYLTRVQMFNYKERPYKDMSFTVYLPTHIIHNTPLFPVANTQIAPGPQDSPWGFYDKWNVWQQNSDRNINCIYFIHFNKYQPAQRLFHLQASVPFKNYFEFWPKIDKIILYTERFYLSDLKKSNNIYWSDYNMVFSQNLNKTMSIFYKRVKFIIKINLLKK